MNYELLVFHCNLIFLLQAGQEVNLIMSCLLTQMLGRLSGLNFEKDTGCLLKTAKFTNSVRVHAFEKKNIFMLNIFAILN